MLTELVTTFIALSLTAATTSETDDTSSDYYTRCAPFSCGSVSFGFPFSPSESFGLGQFDCGLPRFQVACDRTSSVPSVQLSGRSYEVRKVYLSDNLIMVVDSPLVNDVSLGEGGSCNSFGNLTISGGKVGTEAGLTLPIGGVNLTIYVCPSGESLSGAFLKSVVGNYSCSGTKSEVYFLDGTQARSQYLGPLPSKCKYIGMPVSASSLNIRNSSNDGAWTILADVLRDGFPLQWANLTDCVNCESIGGRCGYDSSTRRIICFCKGSCTPGPSNKWKIIVGATIGSTFALLALLLVLKYKSRILRIFKSASHSKSDQKIEDVKTAKEFIKTYQSTLVSNYSYNDLKKITNSFKEKLGEGGYGNVFKAKLTDGRLVAVKMLENYKEDSQNFLNEVTTIGYIHHVNVIRLLGFSWDGSKQALVYEYMPNKSLGDLISKSETISTLGLTKLLEIAIGVAQGIEYLHNGCESRILHLDIKPQNVLLDNNFNPKISDFGLAKVYSRDQSAATMTRARGTIGYIAPEVFLRNLGKPTDRADVYSFGMVLLEMIGVKQNVEIIESDTSEAYFPGYVYDKLIKEKDYVEVSDSIIRDEVYIERNF